MEILSNIEFKQERTVSGLLTAFINSYCSNFSSKNEAFSKLEKKANLTKRSLYRILKNEVNPLPRTSISIIRAITNIFDDDKKIVDMISPQFPEFASHLNEAIEDQVFKPESTFSHKVDEAMMADPIYRKLYVLIETGPITVDEVKLKYGEYGLQVIERMISDNVINRAEDGVTLSQGYVCSTMSGSISFTVGKELVNENYRKEKEVHRGENFRATSFASVDEKTYNELLMIDFEANLRRRELLKRANKGPVRYWNATFTDTLSDELIYGEELEQ